MTLDVKNYFGNQVLYRASSGMERAAADVDADQMLGNKLALSELQAELIIDTWNAYHTIYRNLPFLAWAYDVDLWEDGWSEATQREWVDRQWEFKTKRGTIAAIRMALDFAGRGFVRDAGGYELIQYVTPPQDFFVSPDLSVEEMNAWVRLMPEVRIYLGHDTGSALGDELYLTNEPETQDGFLEVRSAVGYDDGWELYGRRAILRQAGHPDVRLKVIQRHNVSTKFATVDFEDVHVAGLSTIGMFIGEDALEEEKFLDFDELAPRLYRVTLDRNYDSVRTELHLSAIVPTLEPLTARYERNSDIGDAGPFMFLDDGVMEVDFLETDYGALMLADRVYLLDPNITTPMTKGFSFLDTDRLNMHPYTMELMVDLKQFDSAPSVYIDESFFDDSSFVDEDPNHIDRARRAVIAAKSLRDKALMAFDPVRQLQAVDTITGQTRISDWVRNEL